jgi:hypothetical protein
LLQDVLLHAQGLSLMPLKGLIALGPVSGVHHRWLHCPEEKKQNKKEGEGRTPG